MTGEACEAYKTTAVSAAGSACLCPAATPLEILIAYLSGAVTRTGSAAEGIADPARFSRDNLSVRNGSRRDACCHEGESSTGF